MSKDSREAAKSALARLCEWRGLNCYIFSARNRFPALTEQGECLKMTVTAEKILRIVLPAWSFAKVQKERRAGLSGICAERKKQEEKVGKKRKDGRMNRELLEKLSVITEEEQAFLDGRKEIERQRYTDAKALIVDAGKLLEKGKLISVRPHTRFVHFPAHRHNYVEMIYMCQGSVRQRISGDEVCLKAGELLLMNQDAVQEIWPAGREDLAVNFIILPEFFDRTLQMMGNEENQLRDFIIGCLRGKEKSVNYLHFQVSDLLPIQNLVENLVWTILNRQPNKRSIHQVTMGLLFLQLMNYTERVRVGEEHQEQAFLLSVYRYVEEHYRDGQLCALAEEMHYDTCNMSRMIRRLSGKTFTDLLQAKRLQQAAFLLETTRMAVTEIAETVGYENMSYFHRIFRKKYGSSPREYRLERRTGVQEEQVWKETAQSAMNSVVIDAGNASERVKSGKRKD